MNEYCDTTLKLFDCGIGQSTRWENCNICGMDIEPDERHAYQVWEGKRVHTMHFHLDCDDGDTLALKEEMNIE